MQAGRVEPERQYTAAEVERMFKLNNVLLKAMAKQISCMRMFSNQVGIPENESGLGVLFEETGVNARATLMGISEVNLVLRAFRP